jgi:hypothetical protein
VKAFDSVPIEKGATDTNTTVKIIGRINVIRKASAKLYFIDLRSEG